MTRSSSAGGAAAAEESVGVQGLARRQLLHALQRVRSGDFSVQLPGELTGLDG